MLPYVELPEFRLPTGGLLGVELSLQPFGLLWIAGVSLGALVSYAAARRRGLDRELLTSLMFWMMSAAFIMGHLFDVFVYYPEQLAGDWGALLRLWEGQSSFGGFVGALLGTAAWRGRHAAAALPYCDAIASSFPLGFGVGRLGCALVHDHPGVRSDAIFAVAFPDGPRLDMGLLEAGVLLGLATVFHQLARVPRRDGFFLSILCVGYALQRFVLDFWRASPEQGGDVRYGLLTPAQWLAIPLLATGWLLVCRWRTLSAPLVSAAARD